MSAGDGQAREAVRIQCVQRGICRITGYDLQQAGVDLTTIDPGKPTLIHYDQPVPFHLELAQPGRVGPEDAIYFFSEGGLRDSIPFINMEKEYANHSQIFLLYLDGADDDRQIYEPIEPVLPGPDHPPAFNQVVSGRFHYEIDRVWEFFDTESKTDYIFWEKLTRPQSNMTSHTLTNPLFFPFALPDRPMRIHAKCVGVSESGQHQLEITVNNRNPKVYQWDGAVEYLATYDVDLSSLKKKKNEVKLHVVESRDGERPFDVIMLDWIDVEFKQATAVAGDYNEFLILDRQDQRALRHFRISGFSSPDVFVFDADARRVWRGGAYVQGQGEKKYYAVNIDHPSTTSMLVAVTGPRCIQPSNIERVTIGGLFERPLDCELLILTHPLFINELKPLIEWKQSRGLKTAMVNIFDLFNERTGAYPTPFVLRDYIRHVYESQPEPHLRYVLLVGDASSISKYVTYCPDYSYLYSGRATNENFFGNFEDPLDFPKVFVGRFSVQTAEEVKTIVRKIIRYESGETYGPWRATFLTIVANPVWGRQTSDMIFNRYIMPDYLSVAVRTSMDDPTLNYAAMMNRKLVDRFNDGGVIATYLGHGGGTIWEIGPTATSSEFTHHLFNRSSVTTLTNTGRLPLVLALTCYTNNFDNPHMGQTMGETFLNSGGGAIGVIGSSIRSDVGPNNSFIAFFLQNLRSGRWNRLGEIISNAYSNYGWKEIASKYLLLGDPSLEFRLPRPDIALSAPRLDTAAGSVAFDYELPAALNLPVDLDCMLIDEDQAVLTQWREQCSALKGTIGHRVVDKVDLTRVHRIFVYTAQRSVGDFVGVIFP